MPAPRNAASGTSTPLPTKWAVGLIVLLIIYALLQPQLNQRLGWNLPSLTTLQQGEQVPVDVADSHLPLDSKPTSKSDDSAQATLSTGADEPSKSATRSKPKSTSSGSSPASSSSATSLPASEIPPNAALLHGVLRETAPDDYLSTGGLRYTRGSAEGHRLKHIERHLEDDPDRPGKHGVFLGDMPQVLRWIDEAFALGKRGGKGTSKSEEDGRTVYEVSFAKPIGYIGGRDGKRSQNPDANRIRLVVDGNKVITAFPF